MSLSNETFCRRCNARIAFIKSLKTDKHMPVDAVAIRVHAGEDKGTITLETGEVINTHFHPLQEDSWAYISHFSTCPNAKDFRK